MANNNEIALRVQQTVLKFGKREEPNAGWKRKPTTALHESYFSNIETAKSVESELSAIERTIRGRKEHPLFRAEIKDLRIEKDLTTEERELAERFPFQLRVTTHPSLKGVRNFLQRRKAVKLFETMHRMLEWNQSLEIP
ncbi:MAG: hypothetical protein V1644_00625 [Candidatus Micrarchaeota archaeon]